MPDDVPSPDPALARSAASLAGEHLFASRTVLVFGPITQPLAESVTAQVLALAAVGPAPIRVVICSPGGHVESGDAIHDVLRFVGNPIVMIGSGWVASAGALIYAAADRSRRIALPNTRFLLHEPSGGVAGPAADVEIEARQILAMRARLNAIFARATGQTVERIAEDTRRNHWMSAEEAVAYGLVGRIVERASDA